MAGRTTATGAISVVGGTDASSEMVATTLARRVDWPKQVAQVHTDLQTHRIALLRRTLNIVGTADNDSGGEPALSTAAVEASPGRPAVAVAVVAASAAAPPPPPGDDSPTPLGEEEEAAADTTSIGGSSNCD